MIFHRPFCITVISKGCGKKWFLSGLRSYCSTYVEPPNLRSVRKTQCCKNNTDEIKVHKFWNSYNNQNCKHEEINISLNSGNACYHLVQNLVPSYFLTKNIKIKIWRTTILPAVLYGTWHIPHTDGRTQAKGVWGQNAQKNILAKKEEVNRGLKENLLFPSNTIQVITSRIMRWGTYGGTWEVRTVFW